MTNTEIRVITKLEDFKSLEKQWNQLLKKSPVRSAFLTWTWLYSWWNTYGTDKQLWIVSTWHDGTLTGLAPLMLETRRKGVSSLKVLVNIGTPQTDAGGFLFQKDDPSVVDRIVEFILSEKAEWDILEVNILLSAGQERASLTRLINPKEIFMKIEENEHFFVPLTEDWETFSKRLSKKFMHNLRRATRLANDLGTVDLHHITSDKVKPELVQELIDINKHAHFPRLYNSPLEQKLLFELIKNGGDQTNWLDIYILNINEKPIAYEYGFVYEKRFESWRSGFDTNTPQQISVGKLLSMNVFETCIQEGYHEIDFLRGDEAYKLEWKPEKKQYCNIRLFNRKTLQGVLSYHWLQNAKPLLKKSKKLPETMGATIKTPIAIREIKNSMQ